MREGRDQLEGCCQGGRWGQKGLEAKFKVRTNFCWIEWREQWMGRMAGKTPNFLKWVAGWMGDWGRWGLWGEKWGVGFGTQTVWNDLWIIQVEMLSQELGQGAGNKTVNMGVAGTWLVFEGLGRHASSGERVWRETGKKPRQARERPRAAQDLRTLPPLSFPFSRWQLPFPPLFPEVD